MPITPDCELVPINRVRVDREKRQRRQLETASLEASIRRRGLLEPIIVTRQLELIAGERRLSACRNIGESHIFVRFADSLSPIEAELMELEENVHREDLDWQDIARAVSRIHELHQLEDSDWTQGETADSVSLSIGTVSMYLRVASQMLENERVATAGTVREAYNVVLRKEQRAAGDALEELLAPLAEVVAHRPAEVGLTAPPAAPYSVPVGPPPPDQAILHVDFLDWAATYSGPKFNFIHCDFPFGIGLFDGRQGIGSDHSAGYLDTPEVYWRLLEGLCQHLERLMSVSAHLVFWFSEEHGEATRRILRERASSLKVHKYPLVWIKSDNAGIATDVRRTPRHVYETALFASRGGRHLVQVKADAYSAPSDRKLHPSTKPEPMLRHFFTMLVDEHTSMLDPTCGSGAALRAAESLGASRVLGLEMDEQYVGPARKALGNSRTLRVISKGL